MPSAEKIAEVPKALAVCFRHSRQWQWNIVMGCGVGVLKETDPH